MWDGRVVDRAMMDYVVISKYLSGRILDVNVQRGAACGMSDHYLIEGMKMVD